MHSIWLMPEAKSLEPFQREHEALARQFGAPRFDLHLTLMGGRALAPEPLAAILPAIARGIGPFSAPATDIRGSEAFFQSYYALFEAAGPILELKRRAMRLSVNEDIGAFMPHVSLLYGPVEPGEKAAALAASRRRLAGRMLRFRSVALAFSSDAIPVDQWQIQREVVLE